jgi:hypothetical protein
VESERDDTRDRRTADFLDRVTTHENNNNFDVEMKDSKEIAHQKEKPIANIFPMEVRFRQE